MTGGEGRERVSVMHKYDHLPIGELIQIRRFIRIEEAKRSTRNAAKHIITSTRMNHWRKFARFFLPCCAVKVAMKNPQFFDPTDLQVAKVPLSKNLEISCRYAKWYSKFQRVDTRTVVSYFKKI